MMGEKDNTWKWSLGALAVLLLFLFLVGCTSTRSTPCPDPEPNIVTKEVPRPYPVVVKIKGLDPMVLPDLPIPPGHDAGEEEWKAFALEVKRISGERDAKKDARIRALQQLIEDHNRLDVDVAEPGSGPDPPS